MLTLLFVNVWCSIRMDLFLDRRGHCSDSAVNSSSTMLAYVGQVVFVSSNFKSGAVPLGIFGKLREGCGV